MSRHGQGGHGQGGQSVRKEGKQQRDGHWQRGYKGQDVVAWYGQGGQSAKTESKQ